MSFNDSREDLAQTFTSLTNEGGQNYDNVRPPYPNEAIDVIAEACGGDKLLEVGCGSGRATVFLARRFTITAIDPSPTLIAIAEHRVEEAGWGGSVTFRLGKLEDLPFTGHQYDAVVAAQSIHWVAPEARWTIPHAVLRERGLLAFMANFPVTDNSDDSDSQREQALVELYKTHCPQYPKAYGTLNPLIEELEATGLFSDPVVYLFRHDISLSRDMYLTLQRSFSWVQQLGDGTPRQADFLQEVERLLGDAETVRVPWQTVLVTARRLSS